MMDYVRAALILRLKARKRSMEYSKELDARWKKIEERRQIERLLLPRRAA